ncbi:hypothetical protein AVEN_259741-1 [Araneus ventricosus]|uniref:Uncharacterized protein n=1 Tax=Araneus ventricosus TaxID=182803 RepID=A0A4Y2D645_ARAVE|nr:hypothetical protein AVEN_259741-1 [Araneus ventricosus]
MDSEDSPTLIESSEPGASKSLMRKDFITPKLVAALERCQLSMRDSVFILEATIDVLGCNIDEFPIRNFIQIKVQTIPTLVISYGLKEQIIAVSRLDNSTGKEQAQAVWKAILDWNLEDKVQILCYDTTASNIGRFNGACGLLEQKFDR